jgi:GNAT superfamily N-acetyltransferase
MGKIEGVEIGNLGREDLPEAMRLGAQANWNQTEGDWQRLIDLGPRGCFAARLDGRVIGTVTTVIYGKELAWIGMMLVDPEYRRRGLGTILMRRALDTLKGRGVTFIKLDATPAGRPRYESLGFRAEGLIERWEGVGQTGAKKDLTVLDGTGRPAVEALDRQAFGADRRSILNSLITDAPPRPLIARGADGRLAGFVLARPGRRAFTVGPLIARNQEAALSLVEGMFDQLAGEKIFLDFNTAFGLSSKVLAGRGFVKQRDLVRMGLDGQSRVGTSKLVFAIAGPELG